VKELAVEVMVVVVDVAVALVLVVVVVVVSVATVAVEEVVSSITIRRSNGISSSRGSNAILAILAVG